jgi:hypothetical protein
MMEFSFKKSTDTSYELRYWLTSEGHVFPADALGTLIFLPQVDEG